LSLSGKKLLKVVIKTEKKGKKASLYRRKGRGSETPNSQKEGPYTCKGRGLLWGGRKSALRGEGSLILPLKNELDHSGGGEGKISPRRAGERQQKRECRKGRREGEGEGHAG